nr:hypothetical protein REQ54_03535 [Rhizobium sp. Q54]
MRLGVSDQRSRRPQWALAANTSLIALAFAFVGALTLGVLG